MPDASGQTDLVFFDPAHLLPMAERFAPGYDAAPPFPHVVIDDFLPEGIAERILEEFPPPDFAGYKQPDNPHQQGKLGRVQDGGFAGLSPFLRHILGEFNGMAFLDFLERLTGIPGLIADPHYVGGALHQIVPGGRLAIHADFNVDKRRQLDRRINALIYFGRDWQDAWGGHLELWHQDMSSCAVRVAPVFNRCVIFNTTSTAFHGHPEPLACPEGVTRKSIALYYYTNGRPVDERRKPHNTLWQERPGAPGGKRRSGLLGWVKRSGSKH